MKFRYVLILTGVCILLICTATLTYKPHLWKTIKEQSEKLTYNFVMTLMHTTRSYENNPEIQLIDLKIESKDFHELVDIIQYARKLGYRDEHTKKWIGAKLYINREEYDAQVRIRGNEYDHWNKKKISLRVKLNKKKLWNHMRSFSLIIPEDREFSIEAIASFYSDKAGLLSPNEDFVALRINGVHQGVFVLSEELDRWMIERNHRPNSVVLKTKDHLFHNDYTTNEEVIYNASSWNVKNQKAGYSREILGILDFIFNILRREDISKKEAYQKLSYFLDMEKFAKFNAICRLVGSHGEVVHSSILYFNNKTGRFEPILLDVGFDLLEKGRFELGGIRERWAPFTSALISNQTFFDLRNRHLNHAMTWREEFTSFYDEWWRKYRKFIFADPIMSVFSLGDAERSPETIDYRRATNHLAVLLNHDFTRRHLPALKQAPEKFIPSKEVKIPVVLFTGEILNQEGRTRIRSLHNWKEDLYLSRIIFRIPKKARDKTPRIDGLQPLVREKGKFKEFIFNFDQFILPKETVSEIGVENLASDQTQVQYDVTFLDGAPFPEYKIFQSFLTNQSNDFAFLDKNPEQLIPLVSDISFDIKGSAIFIHPGSYTVHQNLIIPKGYHLKIPAGVTLFFKENVSLISYSPVKLAGSQESPIQLLAEDESKGWGVFAVLQTNETDMRNEVNHVLMKHAHNGLLFNGIQFTGGLVFSEADVSIINSKFSESGVDDAVNIIDSEVHFENNMVVHNSFDGFDGDWIRGRFLNNTFYANGGDGIDFSGSRDVHISGNRIFKNQDKGVSLGEETHIASFENNILGNNAIGLASKDKSVVHSRQNTYFKNATALAAYQKKLIFGGAVIQSNKDVFMRNGEVKSLDNKSAISIHEGEFIEEPSMEFERYLDLFLKGLN